jgi:hypothetical protein
VRVQRHSSGEAWGLEVTVKEAARSYHRVIQEQKEKHWEEFMGESSNIWQMARYLKLGTVGAFDKMPALRRMDGTVTSNDQEQAGELLGVFFPDLPEYVEEEGEHPQQEEVPMPRLTTEEIQRCVTKAKL